MLMDGITFMLMQGELSPDLLFKLTEGIWSTHSVGVKPL